MINEFVQAKVYSAWVAEDRSAVKLHTSQGVVGFFTYMDQGIEEVKGLDNAMRPDAGIHHITSVNGDGACVFLLGDGDRMDELYILTPAEMQVRTDFDSAAYHCDWIWLGGDLVAQ